MNEPNTACAYAHEAEWLTIEDLEGLFRQAMLQAYSMACDDAARLCDDYGSEKIHRLKAAKKIEDF